MYQNGEPVFLLHKDDSWVPATVTGTTGQKFSCRIDRNDALHVPAGVVDDVPAASLHKSVPDADTLGQLDDLLSLTYLHESTLLQSVRQRYFRSIIYTHIGPIVIALNPFDYTIPHYLEREAAKYIAQGSAVVTGTQTQLLPHAWTTAHQAFWLMREFRRNQSIIVSGESGAGKTETAKIVARYLGLVSFDTAKEASPSPVPEKVNKSGPILEAFGNAKTVRNDNSSRFGKFMKIHFATNGAMVGAQVEVYLLEKSRVVAHSPEERAYHAFYQIAAHDAATGQMWRIGDTCRGLPAIEGISDLDEYNAVAEAMNAVGLPVDRQLEAWRVCAGILHILRLGFTADSEDSCVVDPSTSRALELACAAWGIPAAELKTELLSTTTVVNSESFVRRHRVDKAKDVRDALCKALYERLFLRLVDFVNVSVGVPAEEHTWIGLLDIFGFESFKLNSFEQLCINLANETLQGHYNHVIFTRDMEECREEGIDTQSVVFQDNSACLDMISGKGSILALLDEECLLGKGTDLNFCDKVTEKFKQHPSFVDVKTNRSVFGVKHYAGDVQYTVDGFREKNSDTMKSVFRDIFSRSPLELVSQLLVSGAEAKSVTVGAMFRSQLKKLMEVLYSTNPHWIRCVKPHPSKRPMQFHGVEVMSQLKSAGVLETIRIRQMSFLVRFTFADFVKHFRVVAPTLASVPAQAARAIIAAVGLGPEVAQVGRSKVFLKVEGFQAVARARDAAWAKSAAMVQRVLRARASEASAARHRADWYVSIAQASIAALLSARHMRRVQLAAEEQRLITLFRGVLLLQIEEDAVRQQFIANVDNFSADAQCRAHALAVAAHREKLDRMLRTCEAEERRSREVLAAQLWTISTDLEAIFNCAVAESHQRFQICSDEQYHGTTLGATHDRIQRLCAEWFEFVREQERASVEEVETEYRNHISSTALSELAVLHASSDIVMEEVVFRMDVTDEADRGRAALHKLYIGASITLLMREARSFRSRCRYEEEQRFIALSIAEVRARDDAVQATWVREREDAIKRIEQQVAMRRVRRG